MLVLLGLLPRQLIFLVVVELSLLQFFATNSCNIVFTELHGTLQGRCYLLWRYMRTRTTCCGPLRVRLGALGKNGALRKRRAHGVTTPLTPPGVKEW